MIVRCGFWHVEMLLEAGMTIAADCMPIAVACSALLLCMTWGSFWYLKQCQQQSTVGNVEWGHMELCRCVACVCLCTFKSMSVYQCMHVCPQWHPDCWAEFVWSVGKAILTTSGWFKCFRALSSVITTVVKTSSSICCEMTEILCQSFVGNQQQTDTAASLKLEGGGNDWICKPSDLEGFSKVDLQWVLRKQVWIETHVTFLYRPAFVWVWLDPSSIYPYRTFI